MKQNPYVIVIDDDPDEGLLITRIFAKLDAPVDLCILNNGEEAIEKLKSPEGREPSLVIMDNKMPKLTGTQVAHELKQYQHIQEIPIIMMSADFSRKEMREAYRAGIRSCVVKGKDTHEWSRNLRGVITYWLNINLPISLAHEDY